MRNCIPEQRLATRRAVTTQTYYRLLPIQLALRRPNRTLNAGYSVVDRALHSNTRMFMPYYRITGRRVLQEGVSALFGTGVGLRKRIAHFWRSTDEKRQVRTPGDTQPVGDAKPV